MKEDLEREIHRLREFGSAMRNQLNLLQRESVVGARTATRKVLEMSGKKFIYILVKPQNLHFNFV